MSTTLENYTKLEKIGEGVLSSLFFHLIRMSADKKEHTEWSIKPKIYGQTILSH